MKRLWVVSIFPEYFRPFCQMGVASNLISGLFASAPELQKEFLTSDYFELRPVDLRSHVPGQYKAVDDTPYGGGPGMVMRADILKRSLEEGIYPHYQGDARSQLHIVFPSPRGEVWSQEVAKKFAHEHLDFKSPKDIVFICGRYEGIDERFIQKYVDQHISLGDYILTGGEIAVLAILDSAMRFVPGVLGNKNSSEYESFCDGLLEHPQYTRPKEFEGMDVPEVLAGGHHAKIQAYQRQERERLTQKYRPDLWEKSGGKT